MASESSQASASPIERKTLVAVLLVALAFATYGPALGNGFYNDDALFLNHARRVLEHPSALLTDRPLGYLRPVWSLFVTALYAVFGLAPRGFFLAGILLHAGCAFLVWRIAMRLLARPVAALAAATAFTVFFAHCEATLWFSAVNSSLVCFFALAMLLSHIDACEGRGIGPALRTAALAVLMLLTKEPGIVAVAWLPLAEWRMRGLRACFERRALARYAIVAVAAALYLWINPRLVEDALGGDGAVKELRSTFGFVTPGRVIGTAMWMWSPVRHEEQDLAPWLGAIALLLPAMLALAFSRGRVKDALLSAAILVIALAPACSTRLLQFNGSRLYYFPTVGAALAIGVIAAVALDALAARGRGQLANGSIAVALVLLAAVHVRTIHRRNAIDYRPISLAQTRLATEARAAVAANPGKAVYILEPWIDNLVHAREFLGLFSGIESVRVTGQRIPRIDGAAWLERQRSVLGNAVLDCDADGALYPAIELPSLRNSSQNHSRAADSGIRAPEVRAIVIRP